ncbi:MAG: hypothetical protein DYG90_05715, partial [Chloroflexi bacterium CFX6]|nr:hypothetical protein [Chloroflexi bacterium CFX6]
MLQTRYRRLIAGGAVLLAMMALGMHQISPASAQADDTPDLSALFKQITDGVFLPNEGQWPDEPRFRSGGNGSEIWFAPDRIMYALVESQGVELGKDPESVPPPPDPQADQPQRYHNVEVAFAGANEEVELVGDGPLDVEYNWLVGDVDVTGVHPFARIAYKRLWNGIDLQFHGDAEGAVKSVFVVAPGADTRQIQLRYTGQDGIRIDPDGNLVLATSLGEIIEKAPVAFTADGERVPVAFLLDGSTVTIKVDTYDTRKVLYIDPTLVFARQLGGSSGEYYNPGMVEDATSRFILGWTLSSVWTGLPGGGFQSSFQGGQDWFIAKFDLANTTLTAFTFIGTTSTEYTPGELVLAPNGDLLFAGSTATTASFGTAVQYVPIGASTITTPRVAVVRINNALNAISNNRVPVLGGNSSTYGNAIWINPNSGDVYVGGTTCATSGFGPAGS